MSGHIQKRGPNTWRIFLEGGFDEGGKRKRTTVTIRGRKADATAELARMEHELNTGSFVEPSKMTVREYLEYWLKESASRTVAPKTLQTYTQIVRTDLSPNLGHILLPKLKPLQIQMYYNQAVESGRKNGKGGLSPQTVLHHHRVLHKALKQAMMWQLLAANPADRVQAPRPRSQEMHALDEDQSLRLLKETEGTRLHVPVMIALFTGMRRGEVLALRWSDLDFDKQTLTVSRSLEQTKAGGLRFKEPKTGKVRTIALPGLAVAALRKHRTEQARHRLSLGAAYTDNDLIVCAPDGQPAKPDTLTSDFSQFRDRHGFAVRFHDLRHSHASQLLRQGVPLQVVSQRLGHAKVSITLDVYAHLLPGMQEGAVQSMDAAFEKAAERASEV